MTAMSAIAALPAASVLPFPATAAATVDGRAWERAIRRLATVEKEYQSINADHTAAFDFAEAECPYENEFFRRYGLGCYQDEVMGRVRNLAAAWSAIVDERGLYTPLTSGQGREVTAEAQQVVDRFDAWRKSRDAAHDRYNCDKWEEVFNAAVDRRYEAQQAVLNAEAPDLSAMKLKLEILSSLMIGEQDLGSVKRLHSDVERLIGAGNA